jgi:hypothetical protein
LLLRTTREKIEHERKIKFNIQSTYSSKKDFLSSLDGGSRTVLGLIYIYFSAIYLSVLLGNRKEVSLAPLREYIADNCGSVQCRGGKYVEGISLKGVNFREAIKKTIQGLNSISEE